MMNRVISMCCLVVALGVSLAAGEAPVKATAEQIAQVVKTAPQLPLELGFKAKLVDFVDFTNPSDPHDFRDRGTSRVVTGPAGKYRVTAQHRHALFSVRWKAGTLDKPHVLVFEYPDDGKRQTCFFTHESRLSGKKNIDWSLETGVYTGNPLPVSNKMQYHTFFFWPSDKWPVAMVMNWARSGAPAAASRLWVYEIDGALPALKTNVPEPEDPRLIGTIYNWSLVPTRGIYGLANPATAMEHIVDYHRYRGDNAFLWPVVSNNSWGFKCRIPAWDGGNKSDELDKILAVCEKKGMKFIAVFNVGHGFKIGGKTNTPATREEYAKGLRKGFEQFFASYGTIKSLHGIAFDTQDLSPKYGEAMLDNIRDCFGGLKQFTDFVKEKSPRLKVYHFLGGRHIHAQYFNDCSAVMERWEKGQVDWSQHLADEVLSLWKSWKRDPAELKAAPDLTTVYAYQHDDHAIFDTYYQNPRAMYYYDMEASAEKAGLVDTRAALVWNTFFEGYIGLHPGNFWYKKLWVAPDFNPPTPHALAGWARAMSHRDCDLLLCGSWNRKGGGHELTLRRFAAAYRALPPTKLGKIQVGGSTPVIVRAGVYKGKTYVSLLNTTPFAAAIKVDAEVTLAPFELKCLTFDGEKKIVASGDASREYVAWIADRIKDYTSLLGEVKALNAVAAPAAFTRHVEKAGALAKRRRYSEADVALGHALPVELELRKRILQPPRQSVPKIAAAPTFKGDLDAWPKNAADIRSSDENIGTHLFFTSQWEGEKDLSTRLRFAHDGKWLYVGIAVKDNVLCARDGATLFFSTGNYLKWKEHLLKYEHAFSVPLPLKSKEAGNAVFKVRRTADGYVAEGAIDLTKIGGGKNVGWVLQVSDDDNTKLLANDQWARKSILIVPNAPTFTYWNDARTCGEMVFEE